MCRGNLAEIIAQIMHNSFKACKILHFQLVALNNKFFAVRNGSDLDSNSSSYKFIKMEWKFTTTQANLLFDVLFEFEFLFNSSGQLYDVNEGSLNGIVEKFESYFFNGWISCGFMLEIIILRSSNLNETSVRVDWENYL